MCFKKYIENVIYIRQVAKIKNYQNQNYFIGVQKTLVCIFKIHQNIVLIGDKLI